MAVTFFFYNFGPLLYDGWRNKVVQDSWWNKVVKGRLEEELVVLYL